MVVKPRYRDMNTHHPPTHSPYVHIRNKQNKDYEDSGEHIQNTTKVRSFFKGTIQLEIVLHDVTLTHPAIKSIRPEGDFC